MVVLLVLTRTIAPVKAWLTSPATTIAFEDLFGSGITSKVQVLYLPGTVLILASLFTFFLHKMSAKDYGRALKSSGSTMIAAARTSARGADGAGIPELASERLASMPIVLAEGMSGRLLERPGRSSRR